MKPIYMDINNNISKQTYLIYNKISNKYSDKFIELIKLRNKGKLGDTYNYYYRHMAVIYFKSITNRVS